MLAKAETASLKSPLPREGLEAASVALTVLAICSLRSEACSRE